MSINTRSATAIVRFTGLGILCFNPRKKRAENLFIHADDHILTVEIYKPVSAAENETLTETGSKDDFPDYAKFSGYWHRRTAYYENLDQSQLSATFDRIALNIEISGEGAPEVDGYRLYEPDSFSRTDEGEDVDLKDFRWIVNVQRDRIFGDGTIVPVANPQYNTTKLFISNAEFYTASIAREDVTTDMVFKKVPLVDSSANETDKLAALGQASDFGRIGADIGAAINADQVDVKIRVGDEEHMHSLPRIHRPYIIYIKNNAERASSDIPIYKQYWEDTGEAFDLLTEDEIDDQKSELGTGVGARVMCNGVVVDEPETIEPFIGGGSPGGGDGSGDSGDN